MDNKTEDEKEKLIKLEETELENPKNSKPIIKMDTERKLEK